MPPNLTGGGLRHKALPGGPDDVIPELSLGGALTSFSDMFVDVDVSEPEEAKNGSSCSSSSTTSPSAKKKTKSKAKKGAAKKEKKKGKKAPATPKGRASKRGAPSDLKARKQTGTDNGRQGICSLFCKLLVSLIPRQKGCDECFGDLRAMKNDAKLAGGKAIKIFKEAQKDHELLCIVHDKWLVEAGPRTGASRCGVFKWARLVEEFERSQGFRRELEKEQRTTKEFVTRMVAKGMDADWAVGEFSRRLALPDEFICDTDPDCGMVRVQCHSARKEIGFDEYRRATKVQQGTGDVKMPKAV